MSIDVRIAMNGGSRRRSLGKTGAATLAHSCFDSLASDLHHIVLNIKNNVNPEEVGTKKRQSLTPKAISPTAQIVERICNMASFNAAIDDVKRQHEFLDGDVNNRFQLAYEELKRIQSKVNRRFRDRMQTPLPEDLNSFFLFVHTAQPASLKSILGLTVSESVFLQCLQAETQALTLTEASNNRTTVPDGDTVTNNRQMLEGRIPTDCPEFFILLQEMNDSRTLASVHTTDGGDSRIGFWLDERPSERKFLPMVVEQTSGSHTKVQSLQWKTMCEYIRYRLESEMDTVLTNFIDCSSPRNGYQVCSDSDRSLLQQFLSLYILKDILCQYIDPQLAGRRECCSDYINKHYIQSSSNVLFDITKDKSSFASDDMKEFKFLNEQIALFTAPPSFFERLQAFLGMLLCRFTGKTSASARLSILNNLRKHVAKSICESDCTSQAILNQSSASADVEIRTKQMAKGVCVDSKIDLKRDVILCFARSLLQESVRNGHNGGQNGDKNIMMHNEKLFEFGCELMSMVYEIRYQPFLASISRRYKCLLATSAGPESTMSNTTSLKQPQDMAYAVEEDDIIVG
eukprot:GILK01004225.1.p1 GENE.GILK01004225.1~~GILK01004225.1.p1  ORF type:complete len:572 (-),score=100.14 GILK01004225.1:265-1980(-)